MAYAVGRTPRRFAIGADDDGDADAAGGAHRGDFEATVPMHPRGAPREETRAEADLPIGRDKAREDKHLAELELVVAELQQEQVVVVSVLLLVN